MAESVQLGRQTAVLATAAVLALVLALGWIIHWRSAPPPVPAVRVEEG